MPFECEQLSREKKVKSAEQSKVEVAFMEYFQQEWALNLTVVLVKKVL